MTAGRADLPLWRYPHLLIAACQMGDEDWAHLLGLSVAETSAWLDGEHHRAEPARARLRSLHVIITALGRARTGQGIASWLREPLAGLGGERPIDWIAQERPLDVLLLAARREAARCWGIGERSPYWPD